jgi:prepilin-type N-terminal cleavage/methylation domain-containing protein
VSDNSSLSVTPPAPLPLAEKGLEGTLKASSLLGNSSSGFTLIELLIVIVVLGILGVVVLFALGGITSKSAVASCQADGQTVSTAITSLNSEAPGVFAAQAAIAAGSAENVLLGTLYGGPYISSWPNNLPHYAFSVSSGGVLMIATSPADQVTLTSPFVAYTGPSSCPSTIN